MTLKDLSLIQSCDQTLRVANVLMAQDYYPFGMVMPGRSFQGSDNYRYGFQGQEKDDEIKGEGNSLDFGARIHDPRLGRFLSVDPDAVKYPFMSPYCFAANSPIRMIDLDGRGPEDAIAKMLNEQGVTLTKKQTAQFIATVMAESNQGKYAQREIAWVYLNLIKDEGFEKGMSKSTAYRMGNAKSDPKKLGIWYKAYMIKLGYGEEFKDDEAHSRHMKVSENGKERTAKNIGEYVEKNGYFNSTSVSRLNKMKKFIEDDVLKNQDKNPIKGWKGQGFYGDLNNYGEQGDHWNQVRQYYVLKQEGKIKGGLIKTVGSGRNATFLFDREAILKFFEDNPNYLPEDRSKIKRLNGTKVVGT